MIGRPRNRQRQPQTRESRPDRRADRRHGQSQPATSVPNISQVVHGAAVSIVLKQDQPTGHQVQGIVQDVLTRGNHPRGIKVRLTDGRVGRVQSMGSQSAQPVDSTSSLPQSRSQHYGDAEPPPRTLADYLPDLDPGPPVPRGPESGSRSVHANCPVCGDFEGDEIAVSRHVETHFQPEPT